jgi:hypothetical protein
MVSSASMPGIQMVDEQSIETTTNRGSQQDRYDRGGKGID